MGGLIQSEHIRACSTCSYASSTNKNAHNKTCCNAYANVFFRPFAIDRNVDVAALFGAAAGHNLHNLQGIACTIRHGLSSGQLKQPQLHSLQPTQIIHDPGS